MTEKEIMKDGVIKRIIIVLFILIISIPTALQIAGDFTGKKYDVILNGYTDTYKKPVPSKDEWLNGYYQKKYTDWVDNSYATRGFYIKNFNQLRYTVFNKGNRIIGENGNIFENIYINSQLCLYDKYNFVLDENRIKLKEYVDQLEGINEKLRKCGKRLFFYITPSKAHYYPNDIPYKFYVMQDSGEHLTGYEYLLELLKKTDLFYFDTNELYPEVSNTAGFYSTGIHWSRPFEQIADSKIINMLSYASSEKYKEIELRELNSSDTPYWRDNDVQNLLNIYTKPNVTYYEYDCDIKNGGVTKPLRAVIQGGSFSEGLIHDFFDKALDSSFYYIFYMDFARDGNTKKTKKLSSWEDVDLQSFLDTSEWMIIEINEAAISGYSDGFVKYLNDYLDSYTPQSPVSVLDANFEPDKGKGLSRARGYYDYEKTFCWVMDDSCLNLCNDTIKDKGLRMDFCVPNQILTDGPAEVSVYINGGICLSAHYTQPGDYSIELSPKKMIHYDDNVYSIEIICDKSFVPKEINENSDSRKLSLRIKYIGENM